MGSDAFAQLTKGANEEVDLARAALEIGRIVTPDLDDDAALAELDRLAWQVRAGLGHNPSPHAIAERITSVLFAEEGFAGDGENYDAPQNSCLHAVLARRRGMPITLSVVVIEVALLAGLDVHGVGAPGHFLVKFHDGNQDHFLDPFHDGREIPVAALRAAVEQATGGPEAAGAYLEAVTKRQILSRILTNLKASYVRRHDPARALQAVDYQLAMAPWALDEVRDRGLLLAELRRDHEALAALRQYRTHGPASVDMDAIDAVIAQIEHRPAEGEGS